MLRRRVLPPIGGELMLRDGAEPCGNGAASVKTVDAPNRLIKRLLRQLLGNVLTVGQRKQIRIIQQKRRNMK